AGRFVDCSSASMSPRRAGGRIVIPGAARTDGATPYAVGPTKSETLGTGEHAREQPRSHAARVALDVFAARHDDLDDRQPAEVAPEPVPEDGVETGLQQPVDDIVEDGRDRRAATRRVRQVAETSAAAAVEDAAEQRCLSLAQRRRRAVGVLGEEARDVVTAAVDVA